LPVLFCLSCFACLSFRSVLPFLFYLPVLHEHEITSAKIKERKCTKNARKSAKIEERESANAKAQNLRLKKKRKNASAKSSAQER
jgi:hypothetical protein